MLKFKTINYIFALLMLGCLLWDITGSVPGWLYLILVIVYCGIVAYGCSVLSAQFFLPVRFKGKESSNSVALTFDDGPIAGKTEEILKILESYGVKASFFCIGNRVAGNPELTKQIHNAGHLIGNHSYWHKNTFDFQSATSVGKELFDTNRAIEETIGVKPAFFRPPYGVTNPMIAQAVKKGGFKAIGWSIRSFDTMIKDGSVLLNRITKSLKAGDVILLHDYCDSTMEILPALLDHIKNLGLKIVRVDQLLDENGYVHK